MLKSLHQLQVENRRLEEQIKNLTAKKERLQLLNAQLSVPFPTIAANPSPPHPTHTFSAHTGEYGSTWFRRKAGWSPDAICIINNNRLLVM